LEANKVEVRVAVTLKRQFHGEDDTAFLALQVLAHHILDNLALKRRENLKVPKSSVSV